MRRREIRLTLAAALLVVLAFFAARLRDDEALCGGRRYALDAVETYPLPVQRLIRRLARVRGPRPFPALGLAGDAARARRSRARPQRRQA